MKEREYSDKPPATRRKFKNLADELIYVYDKLLYWFYDKGNLSVSRKFALRMEEILEKSPDNAEESIFGNECLALINEVEGNWKQAITYRKKEIGLIYRLRELAKTEKPLARKRILKDFDAREIADRYELLAIELWNDGQI